MLYFFILFLISAGLLLWKKATVGTKSVLIGAHCFFIHPWFVALAWWKLYGFPTNIRLWVAFFVHDIGYIGKPNMDGSEGETHPYLGAKIMHKLFDRQIATCGIKDCKFCKDNEEENHIWYKFTLYHSRFLARKNDEKYSKLCVADKYAICLTPTWLYVPMALLSGEIHEYIKDAEKNSNGVVKKGTYVNWHKAVKEYVNDWVMEHKDLKEDTWTPKNRTAIDKNGVWK